MIRVPFSFNCLHKLIILQEEEEESIGLKMKLAGSTNKKKFIRIISDAELAQIQIF